MCEGSRETDSASLNCTLVRHCREAILDAQVLVTIAGVVVEKAHACASDLDSFNSIEFTEKLVGITPWFLNLHLRGIHFVPWVKSAKNGGMGYYNTTFRLF